MNYCTIHPKTTACKWLAKDKGACTNCAYNTKNKK